jgi:hypothetical protein
MNALLRGLAGALVAATIMALGPDAWPAQPVRDVLWVTSQAPVRLRAAHAPEARHHRPRRAPRPLLTRAGGGVRDDGTCIETGSGGRGSEAGGRP